MITQKKLAERLGITHVSEVRDLVHSMRAKGWGVLSNGKGMARTESRRLRDEQAKALIARAKEIITAAEGLAKANQEELTEVEARLWNLLPEVEDVIETYDSSEKFPYIREEDADGLKN